MGRFAKSNNQTFVAIDRPRKRNAFRNRKGQIHSGAAILSASLRKLAAVDRMFALKKITELLFGYFGFKTKTEYFSTMTMPVTVHFLPQVVVTLCQYLVKVLTRSDDVFSLGCDKHVERYGAPHEGSNNKIKYR